MEQEKEQSREWSGRMEQEKEQMNGAEEWSTRSSRKMEYYNTNLQLEQHLVHHDLARLAAHLRPSEDLAEHLVRCLIRE